MALAALAITTLATPVNITSFPQSRILSKRATPGIKKGDYTKQHIIQIKQGHADAIKMASTVVSWSKTPDSFDPIFKKYFNIQDRDAVVGKDCPWASLFRLRIDMLTGRRRLQANCRPEGRWPWKWPSGRHHGCERLHQR